MDDNSFLLDGKYKVTAFLGKGGFASTYGAFIISSHQEVAIKISKKDESPQNLEREAMIGSQMSGVTGFPRFINFQYCNGEAIYVMEFLGRSIGSLMNFLGHPLSLKSIYMLADQMISRIQYLHERNFIHRDIKPDNFLLGRGSNHNIIYLIDFGLCQEYRNPHTLEHYPQKTKSPSVGTPMFSSINSQLGRSTSRRDDIESLAYSLIFLAKGSLPWSSGFLSTKLTTSSESVASGLPSIFSVFLNSAKHLHFEETPPYSEYRKMFRDALLNNPDEFSVTSANFEYKFEWDGIQDIEPPLPLPLVQEEQNGYIPLQGSQSYQKTKHVEYPRPRHIRTSSLSDGKQSGILKLVTCNKLSDDSSNFKRRIHMPGTFTPRVITPKKKRKSQLPIPP